MSMLESAERMLAETVLGLPESVLARLAGAPIRSDEGHALDLHTQVLLRIMKLRREPELHVGGPTIARRRFVRSSRLLDREVSNLLVTPLVVPGGAGPRPARRYSPRTAGADLAPCLVYLHGGGWVLGDLDSHDLVCRGLAADAGITVIAVDYRVAPEAPFPAGLDDAIAATRWVLAHAEALGLDATNVTIGGDSAGANLATVAALAMRDDARRPARQLLVYPVTDATRALPSHARFGHGFILTEGAMISLLGDYIGPAGDMRDPRVSPLFAADLAGLPPAVVVIAGFDPLRDEGRAYHRRLVDQGVATTLIEAPTLVHGFLHMRRVVPEASRIMGLLTRALSM